MLTIKTTFTVLAAMALVAASAAPAAIVTWDNDAGDGDWFNPLNWSDDLLPAADDEVTLDAATVQAGDTVVTDMGGELLLTNSASALERLIVGLGGEGNAELTMGSDLVTGVASIGDLEGSQGYVLATGSDWTADRLLTVGASGDGALDLHATATSGAGVVGLFHRAQGAVAVYGGTWICETDLTVGMYGDGELTVDSAGSVIGSFCTVGFGEGVSGAVSVAVGSEMTVDAFVVGYSGIGSLEVDNASMNSGTAIVGGKWELMPPGVGTATIDNGGRWGCAGDLFIGESGDGTVNIGSMSEVCCRDGYLGYGDGAIGVLNLTDDGAIWTGENMFIGCYGEGHVVISGGGLGLDGRLYIGYRPGGSGTLSVNGTLWDFAVAADELRVGGDITQTNDGEIRTDGLLELLSPSADVVITKAINFGACGALHAVGGARIKLAGASFGNDSTDPAALDDLLNVELDFGPAAAGGVSTVEVAAADNGAGVPGLNLVGRFALGTLTVGAAEPAGVQLVDASDNQPDTEGAEALYVNELVLGPGSTLDLNGLNLYYNTLIDMGGTVVANGGELQPIYLAGDVDDDGDVDIDDFVELKKSFGATQGATQADGDLNGDGAVNLEDFVILKKNFAL